MNRRPFLIISALALAPFLVGAKCSRDEPLPASVLEGACKVFRDPGFAVKGATKRDQRWISVTQENGIRTCGWERPAPPPEPQEPAATAGADALAPAAPPAPAREPARKRWFGV